MPDYLGTSSNWSFTRRVLLLASEHAGDPSISSQPLLFDGAVYDIDWAEFGGSDVPGFGPPLPTLDHAIYLINSVKFHCCQLFHLFDEESFMESCHSFYAGPKPDVSLPGLWYHQFRLVIALGKAFLSRPHRGKMPPGHEFFLAVMRSFPSIGVLVKEPLLAIEVMMCAALYLQCIDHRQYANILVSTAALQILG